MSGWQFSHYSPEVITSAKQLEALLIQKLALSDPQRFFSPPHPQELNQNDHQLSSAAIARAVKLLQKAIGEEQSVLIYGDYDCDGITATAIMWETLFQLGLTAQPYLPQRETDGYGINVATLERLWKDKPFDLVVTVDNGIVAHEAMKWLKQHKVQVILTDHHQADNHIPEATVVLHSTRLAGAGVAWYLSQALAPDLAQDKLDLAVLGTVADQVPVLGANRSIIVHGLEQLRQSTRPSLKMLAKRAGIKLAEADTHTIGFVIAPRLNAVGRLGDPMDALRALLDRNPTTLSKSWQEIENLNDQRRALTGSNEDWTDSLVTSYESPVHVLQGNWPEGIIGLMAGRWAEKHHRPTLVLTQSGQHWKASARSYPGLDLIKWLRSFPQDLFLSLGGHTLAAGFSVADNQVEAFLEELTNQSQKLDPTDFQPHLPLLAPLDPASITYELIHTLEQFAPFGSQHESPLFSLPSMKIVDLKPVGAQKQHAQISALHQETGTRHRLICWRYEEKQLSLGDHTLAVALKGSSYRPGTVELELLATQPSAVAQ